MLLNTASVRSSKTLLKQLLVGALFVCSASSQTLPPTSRTVFKCEEGGKVHYSDSPCLGAKKIDVEPTRGLSKSSGKEIVGKDVQREQQRAIFAEAIRPITGMDQKQLDTSGRRTRLPLETQRECQRLDRDVPLA